MEIFYISQVIFRELHCKCAPNVAKPYVMKHCQCKKVWQVFKTELVMIFIAMSACLIKNLAAVFFYQCLSWQSIQHSTGVHVPLTLFIWSGKVHGSQVYRMWLWSNSGSTWIRIFRKFKSPEIFPKNANFYKKISKQEQLRLCNYFFFISMLVYRFISQIFFFNIISALGSGFAWWYTPWIQIEIKPIVNSDPHFNVPLVFRLVLSKSAADQDDDDDDDDLDGDDGEYST